MGGRLTVVSAVVSDWWCSCASAVVSSLAVVAGEVVPNRRRVHRWLYLGLYTILLLPILYGA